MFLDQVTANDADGGAYGLVTYSMLKVSNNGGNKFQMDSNGTLYAISAVVRLMQYEILVQAQDSDPNPLTRRLDKKICWCFDFFYCPFQEGGFLFMFPFRKEASFIIAPFKQVTCSFIDAFNKVIQIKKLE